MVAPSRRGPGRHASERGAAMFAVVLVLTLLTGLGLFATKSTTTSVGAAGFERRATQANHAADYAILLIAGELQGPKRQAYMRQMGCAVDACEGSTEMSNPDCFKFGQKEVGEGLLQSNDQNFITKPYDAATKAGGSLGRPITAGTAAEAEMRFRVEMTDLGSERLIPGAEIAQSDTVNVKYRTVTLTATAAVQPAGADDNAAIMATQLASRAEVIVGPLGELPPCQ